MKEFIFFNKYRHIKAIKYLNDLDDLGDDVLLIPSNMVIDSREIQQITPLDMKLFNEEIKYFDFDYIISNYYNKYLMDNDWVKTLANEYVNNPGYAD